MPAGGRHGTQDLCLGLCQCLAVGEQVACLVDIHLHLGKGLGLEHRPAVQHQAPGLQVDFNQVAALNCS